MSSFSPNTAANDADIENLNVQGLTLEQSLDILDSLPAEGAAAATIPVPPAPAQSGPSSEGRQIIYWFIYLPICLFICKQTNK